MSKENKEKAAVTEEKIQEKVNFFKRTWKYAVTGITCAAVGVGVTLGADALRVQETLTKAQARQVAMAAAAYSAEQVLTKVTTIATSEKKTTAVKEVLEQVQKALPEFISAAAAAKETVTEVKGTATEVKKAKEAVKEEKEAAKATVVETKKATEEVKKTE